MLSVTPTGTRRVRPSYNICYSYDRHAHGREGSKGKRRLQCPRSGGGGCNRRIHGLRHCAAEPGVANRPAGLKSRKLRSRSVLHHVQHPHMAHGVLVDLKHLLIRHQETVVHAVAREEAGSVTKSEGQASCYREPPLENAATTRNSSSPRRAKPRMIGRYRVVSAVVGPVIVTTGLLLGKSPWVT